MNISRKVIHDQFLSCSVFTIFGSPSMVVQIARVLAIERSCQLLRQDTAEGRVRSAGLCLRPASISLVSRAHARLTRVEDSSPVLDTHLHLSSVSCCYFPVLRCFSEPPGASLYLSWWANSSPVPWPPYSILVHPTFISRILPSFVPTCDLMLVFFCACGRLGMVITEGCILLWVGSSSVRSGADVHAP